MKQLAPVFALLAFMLAFTLGFSVAGAQPAGTQPASTQPAGAGRIEAVDAAGKGPRSLPRPRGANPRLTSPALRGAPTRVSLLTMGPGDHPFARFGHTALLIEWRGYSRVYNFGTFVFDGLQGVEDFMAGRFRYWLSVTDLRTTLAHYRAEERSLIAQDLNLTRAQRLELARALDENARPENRFYDYDYYKDNCTTRVRDAIDDVLGGALRHGFREPGRLTFREHTERLSADELGLYIGLDLALGRFTDRTPDRFEELWIPDQLSQALDEATVERGGRQVPLVRSTRVLANTERPPPRSAPPSWVPRFGLAGLALGGVFAGLGLLGAGRLGNAGPLGHRGSRRAARVLFGVLTALLGLCVGLLGSVVFVFWFTKHWAAHQNSNVLLFAPWALALTVTGLRMAFDEAFGETPRAATAPATGPAREGAHGTARWQERTRRLAFACAVAAGVGALLPLLPGVGQDNLRLAALMVPLWGGLLLGASALVPRRAKVSGDDAAPNDAAPNDAAPNDAAPNDAAPNDVASNPPVAPETH